MVVELVQTKKVFFNPKMPDLGSFPMRAGVTLIVSAPDYKKREVPEVRFAIGKQMIEEAGQKREDRQRAYYLAMGLLNGDTDDPNHFQANFGLLHQGF
jgi:hypothetical protein